MAGACLLSELARQVRSHTVRLLESAPPDRLTWAPPGTSNHILWHAGHALWVQDALCVTVLTGRSELPAGWADRFGMNCRPVAETSDWPPRQQVRERLEAQLQRVLELFQSELSDRPAASRPGSGVDWEAACRIVHGWHDEARHQGEMYLILKMCRRQTSL